jgi:2'-hydroxyisoflavone reductase
MTRVLVLGGTGWLGGEVARRARDRGSDVTCLARGSTAPDGVRLVRADRSEPGAYDALAPTDWDAVVDVSSQPSQVAAAVRALGERAAHWTYVSSLSVYARTDVVGDDESAHVHAALDGDMTSMADYGAAKVSCEGHVLAGLGARALVVRAGLICGPGDPSDRFGYWPAAFARAGAGEVLVPDEPQLSTHTIDVRDLADWIVAAPAEPVTGVLDAVGERVPLGDLLVAAAHAARFPGRTVPAAPAWLAEQGVETWAGPRSLPLWLPLPEYAGFGARSGAAARRAGLTCRPLADTLADVLADERRRGLDRARRAGLTRAEELALLATVPRG